MSDLIEIGAGVLCAWWVKNLIERAIWDEERHYTEVTWR